MQLRAQYFVGYVLRLLGLILEFLGAIGLGLFVIYPLLIWYSSQIPNENVGLYQLVIFATLSVGAYMAYIGKRITAKSAEEIIEQDTMPPVIYLRSFVDDELAAKKVRRRLIGMAMSDIIFSGTTEEEILAKAFKKIGPCIALGRPGEKLPPLGMARMYFDNSEWKEGIERLIGRAGLVIMRAGGTEGFFWELKIVIRTVHPTKLLLLLPFDAENISHAKQSEWTRYTNFLSEVNKHLPKALPAFHAKRMRGTDLSSIIWFEPDWTPRPVGLKEIGRTLKQSLEAVSKRYLDSKGSVLGDAA